MNACHCAFNALASVDWFPYHPSPSHYAMNLTFSILDHYTSVTRVDASRQIDLIPTSIRLCYWIPILTLTSDSLSPLLYHSPPYNHHSFSPPICSALED